MAKLRISDRTLDAIAEFARSNGITYSDTVAKRFGITEANATAALDTLVAAGRLRRRGLSYGGL